MAEKIMAEGQEIVPMETARRFLPFLTQDLMATFAQLSDSESIYNNAISCDSLKSKYSGSFSSPAAHLKSMQMAALCSHHCEHLKVQCRYNCS
jgi:hypothetical protein